VSASVIPLKPTGNQEIAINQEIAMAEQSSSDPLTTGIHADIEAIEEALVAQWTNYGHAPGGVFHEDDDLVCAEAPVPQLPYNAVLRTRLRRDAAERIEQVLRHFCQRAVQFLWFVHPTAQPTNLAEQLAARGLSLVEHATGMALDLTSWSASPGPLKGPIIYREVQDEQGMRAFEELMAAYWELPAESHPYVFGMNRWAYALGDRGVRWVAYRGRQPVGKAYLSYLGRKDTAAIFGVYVKPTDRGYGIASTLTELAIGHAAALGRKRVVLHSSEMAVNVYRGLGFIDRCILPVYATTALHGVQPI
jgi:ribosomal protein S18 acetylase RimI-like enzyme